MKALTSAEHVLNMSVLWDDTKDCSIGRVETGDSLI